MSYIFQMPKSTVRETKSIRFPISVIERIEQEIRGTDCTFTAFVISAVQQGLDSLEEQRKSSE